MPLWGWVISGVGGLGGFIWLMHRIGWLSIIADCLGSIVEGLGSLDVFDDD